MTSPYESLVRCAPCRGPMASVGAAPDASPTCTPSAGMFLATLTAGIAVGFVIERFTRTTCPNAPDR